MHQPYHSFWNGFDKVEKVVKNCKFVPLPNLAVGGGNWKGDEKNCWIVKTIQIDLVRKLTNNISGIISDIISGRNHTLQKQHKCNLVEK